MQNEIKICIENLLPHLYNMVFIQNSKGHIEEAHIQNSGNNNTDNIFVAKILSFYLETRSFSITFLDEKQQTIRGFLGLHTCSYQFPNISIYNAKTYEGVYILVQQMHSGRLGKSNQYTANICLSNSWFCIFPFNMNKKGLDVSHQIDDNTQRMNLKSFFTKGTKFPYRTIVRSIWKYYDLDSIDNNYVHNCLHELLNIWTDIQQKTNKLIENNQTGIVYYHDFITEIYINAIFKYHNLYPNTQISIIVRNKIIFQAINTYCKKFLHYKIPVKVIPFSDLNDSPMHSLLNYAERSVKLSNNSSISFDESEGGTFIDLNSYRFNAKSDSNLSPACQINLSAIDELMRMIRLKNIAGIIVIDFINMSHHKEIELVQTAIRKAILQDRNHIQMSRMDPTNCVVILSRARGGPILSDIVLNKAFTNYGIEIDISYDWIVFTKLYSLLHSKYQTLKFTVSKEIYKAIKDTPQYMDILNRLSKTVVFNIIDNVKSSTLLIEYD